MPPVPPHADFGPRRNQLLAALPGAAFQRWLPHLVPVQLTLGQVLCEAGGTPASVYFPTTAVVSLMSMTRDGSSTEFAVVGHDGVVGISLFMSGSTMPCRAVVQSPGEGYRMAALAVRSEVARADVPLSLLLRYAQALTSQVAQTALCNRFHSIDQQLCRRLLMGLDRSNSADLQLTQELAASLLGVRREGVTAAASKLRADGVINYHRGHIEVLDRHGLEQRTCECYSAARHEYERLLPMAAAA